jgi:hypothetical protein
LASERGWASLAGGALAVSLLAGCGGTPAELGPGAAPFSEAPAPGATGPATPGVLKYPAESLTIHYAPKLAADRKDAVLAYGAFQVELQRAVRTGVIGKALTRRTLPQEMPTLRKQIDLLRKANTSTSNTVITVDKVTINGANAGLELCTHVSDANVPAFVVMTRDHRLYKVSALGPDKRRKTC